MNDVEAVLELAARLADPAAVADRVAQLERDDPPGLADSIPPWNAQALGNGHPSLALFFGTLAQVRPELAANAHAHLLAATRAPIRTGGGIFHGLPAVAFAARCTVRRPGDYAGLLHAADRVVVHEVDRLLAVDRPRLAARAPGVRSPVYDAITGLSGLGRYLLGCGEEHTEALHRVLAHLVAMTETVTVRGRSVPGWWSDEAIVLSRPQSMPDGHYNLGLAHGIAGPLALLSLAYRAGVIVPGQRAAVEMIAAWLLGQRRVDEHGPYWPSVVPFGHEDDEQLPPARTAWCYGAPGIGRAVQTAALALDEPKWNVAAVETFGAALRRPAAQQGVYDAALCHGAGGGARIAALIAADSTDPDLPAQAEQLRQRLLPTDLAAPFIWPAQPRPGHVPVHRPGFLDGAVGTALALWPAAMKPEPHALSWESALLLR